MANTFKEGLDYFSFDVDFFNDEKVEFLAARFGIKGEIIAIKLLCKIYRNGYYCNWNNDECMLFAKRAGDGLTPSLVNEAIQELVRRGFFNETLLNSFKILTSKGIQKRYIQAVVRRKNITIDNRFLLINPDDFKNVSINFINAASITNNVTINKQSKVKEKKRKEMEEELGDESPPIPKNSNSIEDKINLRKSREKEFIDELAQFKGQYERQMLIDFFKYWSEPNRSGSKMRFELERTWDLKKRLSRWQNNDDKWNKTQLKPNTNESIPPLPSGVIEKLQK